MRILFVEDDPSAVRGGLLVLRSCGAIVDTTDMGEEAIGLAKRYDYDIIIMDLLLPDMPGGDIVRKIRASRIDTPIIVVSTQSNTLTRVQLLALGADDYITKPFDPAELIERLRSVIRRNRGFSDSYMRVGSLVLNFALRQVRVNNNLVHLTGKEYAILELLILRKGTILTKEMFLNHLYGGMDEPEIKIIDVFVCKLRKKLANAGADSIIATVWGQGYTIRELSTSAPREHHMKAA